VLPLFIAMPRKAYEGWYRGESSVGAFAWDGSGGSLVRDGELCVRAAASIVGQGAGLLVGHWAIWRW